MRNIHRMIRLDLFLWYSIIPLVKKTCIFNVDIPIYISISDPSSLLGVRLPPDTEIIKYTSSIVGPKIPGTTNRGRKKTISLDPNPLLAGIPGLTTGTGVSPAKRARLEAEYGHVQNAHQSDRVEVIKLPPTVNSNGAYNLSKSAKKETTDSALDMSSDWTAALNFSAKGSTPSNLNDDSDAPLNLCMKSSDSKNNNSGSMASGGSTGSGSSSGGGGGLGGNGGATDLSSDAASNSLQSLSCITAALGSGSGNDRMCKSMLWCMHLSSLQVVLSFVSSSFQQKTKTKLQPSTIKRGVREIWVVAFRNRRKIPSPHSWRRAVPLDLNRCCPHSNCLVRALIW